MVKGYREEVDGQRERWDRKTEREKEGQHQSRKYRRREKERV